VIGTTLPVARRVTKAWLTSPAAAWTNAGSDEIESLLGTGPHAQRVPCAFVLCGSLSIDWLSAVVDPGPATVSDLTNRAVLVIASVMLVVALLSAVYSTGSSLTQLYERVVTVIRNSGAISKETK
jgi:hypothetical protein